MVKEKNSTGSVSSWIFGILFFLIGAMIITSSPLFGTLIILCSLAAMAVLVLNKFTIGKLHPIIFGGIKFLLLIIILLSIGSEAYNGANRMFPKNPVAEVGHYFRSVVEESDNIDGDFTELPLPPRQLGNFCEGDECSDTESFVPMDFLPVRMVCAM
ncbi:MAG: hypothetical protein WC924_03790 [Candidatus Gracilibacteria bacterium]